MRLIARLTFLGLITALALSACGDTTEGVAGIVWDDLNGNGIRDAGESGIANVEVEIVIGDVVVGETMTDRYGHYSHTLKSLNEGPGTLQGQNTVQFKLPDGYRFTASEQGDDDKDSDVDSKGRYPGSIESEDLHVVDVGLVRLSSDVTQTDEDSGKSDSVDGLDLELNSVTTNFVVEVSDIGENTCDRPLPGGGGEAVLRGSDDGFIVPVYNPNGMVFQGDGEGGMFAVFNGPKNPGFGETAPLELDILDFQRDQGIVTIPVSETQFREEYPEGCTRSYTLIYNFADESLLDFLSAVPSGGVDEVGINNPNIDFGDGTINITGKITNQGPGQVCYAWVEVSGTDVDYYMAKIVPEADGGFKVVFDADIPPGTFMIIEILCNGKITASSSGNSPSE